MTRRQLALTVFSLGLISIILGSQKRIPPNALPKKPGLAIGDSLTVHGRWIARYKELSGQDWEKVAIQGWTSKRALMDLPTVELVRYATVAVLLGANDFVNDGLSAAATIRNLTAIYQAARAAGATVVGIVPTPFAGYVRARPVHIEKWHTVCDWIRREAPVDFVVETAPLGDSSGRLLPEYASGDGLHLSNAGQQRLGELVYETLR